MSQDDALNVFLRDFEEQELIFGGLAAPVVPALMHVASIGSQSSLVKLPPLFFTLCERLVELRDALDAEREVILLYDSQGRRDVRLPVATALGVVREAALKYLTTLHESVFALRGIGVPYHGY